MSSSPKRPSSMASTELTTQPPSEKINSHPPDAASDPFLVSFTPDDPDNPLNWSRRKRWWITLAGGILVLNATFASAAPSNLLPQMMDQFGFSTEVATLTVSLFIAGYCVGPLVWGPLSEDIGRRPVYLITFLFYTGFQVGCALSKNTASILIFRFLGGTFAAAPLTNSGALVGDIWDAKTRGKAMLLFAASPFAGPALGPVVSGWIAVTGTSWRWIFWVMTIFVSRLFFYVYDRGLLAILQAGFCLALVFFTVPETFGPVLLAKKAQRIRKETGDNRYYAPSEAKKITTRDRLYNILAMPFKILFLEPMLIAITIYQSFLYGCIYLLFEAYPIVFTEGHNLNAGISGLMFLPVSLGGVAAILVYLVFYNPRYDRYIEQYAPNKVPPEARLEVTLLGAPLFAISFFWFGWTSYPSISLWSPLLAGGLMGFGILLIFSH
ncbi:major facilitator superfamily domain-containing protein [Lactifluus volemus]|nr:major facilitator superfamily domain-containing protein [Lactifluus volemus]